MLIRCCDQYMEKIWDSPPNETYHCDVCGGEVDVNVETQTIYLKRNAEEQ